MKASRTQLLGVVLFVLVLVCFAAGIKFRIWAQETREAQKIILSSLLTQPLERSPQSDAEIHQYSDLKQLLEQDQAEPIIKTCSWFAPDKSSTFNKLINRPKVFENLILDQTQEIGLFSYRLPLTRSLILRLKDTSEFQNDFHFIFDFLLARMELQAHLSKARLVDTHGYYTRLLAKIVRQNPSLTEDVRLSRLCEKIANIESPLSREEMNREIEIFMELAQVRAEEIDYNPRYESRVNLSSNFKNALVYENQPF